MKLTSLFVIVAFTSPVTAADLTVAQCLNVAVAIRALDCAGRDMDTQRSLDLRGAANSTECKKQYRLGALRGPLAFALADLGRIQETVEKTRNSLIAKIGGGKPISPNSPQMTELVEALQAALDAKCDVKMPYIRLGDLSIGDDDAHNQIPMSVLGALSPVIADLPSSPEKKD